MRPIFLQSIRNNKIIRKCTVPFFRAYRKIQLLQYSNSNDSKYLESLRNKFKGERCFIIGNGPSLKVEDLELLKGEFTFGFNGIYHIYPHTLWRPTVYMLTDKYAASRLRDEEYNMIEADYIFINSKKIIKKLSQKCNAHLIIPSDTIPTDKANTYLKEIKEDLYKCISQHPSVSTAGIEMAFYLGFKQIILLGMDHSYPVEINSEGEKRYTDVNPHFKENEVQGNLLYYTDAVEKSFVTCREYGIKRGITIVNATRGGKLEVFQRIDLEQIL